MWSLRLVTEKQERAAEEQLWSFGTLHGANWDWKISGDPLRRDTGRCSIREKLDGVEGPLRPLLATRCGRMAWRNLEGCHQSYVYSILLAILRRSNLLTPKFQVGKD